MSLYKLFLLRCNKQLQGARQPKSGVWSELHMLATISDGSDRTIASQC